MDSACDFDLLGESVPQVRVSARTLALLGFFIVQSILTPFFLNLIFTKILEPSIVTGIRRTFSVCFLGPHAFGQAALTFGPVHE